MMPEAMDKPRVVVLTGAGISAESGIRTFRAADGLWEEHRVEDVATPEGFARDPDLVQAFYNARRRQLQQPESRRTRRIWRWRSWKRRWAIVFCW
jgi:NAD-dependent deacetylase